MPVLGTKSELLPPLDSDCRSRKTDLNSKLSKSHEISRDIMEVSAS